MPNNKTLLELARADLRPAKLRDATLILIDFQHEYLSGPIAVADPQPSIAAAQKLLASARQAGSPVVHVAHRGRAGGLFDRDVLRGQIVSELAPNPGETLIEKGLPNAFAGTRLHTHLVDTGARDLVIAGFMTHMCVSATARAGLDLGFRNTIAAAACGTRDLPDGRGGWIPAATVHTVALAELADRFAVVAWTTEALV